MTETKTQELQKCSRCHSTKLLDTYFSKNVKGLYLKTCNTCRTKNHKCDKCDFKCSNGSDLQRHKKQVHDKIKDQSCDKCDFKFSRAGHLQQHIKAVHDKIKDQACDKCSFKFSTAGNLQQHIKAVHDKIQDHVCDKCSFKCSDAGNLQRHIKSVHDKIKDYVCDKCDFKSSTASDLQKHIKICTGNLNISSGELACRKAFELLGIEYETEVCEIKNDEDNWLRWDFKITLNDKPAYIEYDGEAHFKPVCFGGMDKDTAKKNFIKLQQHDKIKNDYCAQNEYPLLRIPYYRFEEIMELISEFVL